MSEKNLQYLCKTLQEEVDMLRKIISDFVEHEEINMEDATECDCPTCKLYIRMLEAKQ